MNNFVLVDGEIVGERKNVRLAGFDYSQPGAYFITIVTLDREPLFLDEDLSAAVASSWSWLASRYDYVRLDAFVVMPITFTVSSGSRIVGAVRERSHPAFRKDARRSVA